MKVDNTLLFFTESLLSLNYVYDHINTTCPGVFTISSKDWHISTLTNFIWLACANRSLKVASDGYSLAR